MVTNLTHVPFYQADCDDSSVHHGATQVVPTIRGSTYVISLSVGATTLFSACTFTLLTRYLCSGQECSMFEGTEVVTFIASGVTFIPAVCIKAESLVYRLLGKEPPPMEEETSDIDV